jgi:CDP-6-deoxy-D-xylo-4-hexulose-3-dehydrase
MVNESTKEKELREKAILAALDHMRVYHAKKEYVYGDKVPYGGRMYDEQEMRNLIDSSLDFWLTSGRYTDKFEKLLGKYLNVKYVSMVNSGSSANLAAFMALTSPKLGTRCIRRGDEVITVSTGFPTTVTPIIQYGAIPVFLDVTLPEYNVDVKYLEEALSERTKAVMLAHTMGNPFDMNCVKEFCDQHNLWLIEDNCDALGAKYNFKGNLKYTGTIGDIGTSSFFASHHIMMGEGGAVYTDNPQLALIIRSFRDWGRDCQCPPGRDNVCGNRFKQHFGELPYGYDHKYVYSHFGYNLKATEMQAAIGCAQIEKLPNFIDIRRRNWQYLRTALSDLDKYFILPEPSKNSYPSWFGFMLTVKPHVDISRDSIVDYLESKHIHTRMLFTGNLIKQPCFDEMRKTKMGFRIVGRQDNANFIMTNTFWVGVCPGLELKQLDYVIENIRGYISDMNNGVKNEV